MRSTGTEWRCRATGLHPPCPASSNQTPNDRRRMKHRVSSNAKPMARDFSVNPPKRKRKSSTNSETHTSILDVLLVYESVRSGKRAKELCDRLGQQLAPDCKLNLSVWSLSALQLLPATARAAVSAAEHAGLLIVAVNGDKTLPQSVKSFLHRCARAIHAADGAIVAQL